VSISTHVLDATAGRPAAGLGLTLSYRSSPDGGWDELARRITGDDGRVAGLESPAPGDYRIVFDTGSYQPEGFYPEVAVVFRVADPDGHYHVPLLLSPFSYSTYRGS
jgi:5-hydroxyisourate hydrolase